METACDDCRYFVKLSEGVWKWMYLDGKLPDSASLEEKLNFCAMAARFVRSAVFACSIKEGKEGQMNLSAYDEKEEEWMPINIIAS